jgi:hypothetical protein
MSTPNPDNTAAIHEALFAGNKIEAIKLYREQTSLGLKESKDAVEQLEAQLRLSSPDRFRRPGASKVDADMPQNAVRGNSGCASMIAALAVVGAWLWFLV